MKYTSLSLTRYLKELSSDKPIPGGGSASAYAACLGIGLAEMVAQISSKKADRQGKASLRKAIRLLQKARKDALEIVDLDPRVYLAVMKSYDAARRISDEDRKRCLVDQSLEDSFRLQANLALLVAMARQAVLSLDGLVRGSIKNDLRVSRALLNAAFHGSYATAEINQVYLKNLQKKERAARVLEELKKRFEVENVPGG